MKLTTALERMQPHLKCIRTSWSAKERQERAVVADKTFMISAADGKATDWVLVESVPGTTWGGATLPHKCHVTQANNTYTLHCGDKVLAYWRTPCEECDEMQFTVAHGITITLARNGKMSPLGIRQKEALRRFLSAYPPGYAPERL